MIHPITVPKDASITDLVFQEQVAQLPPELVGNIDRLLQLAQFTTGDLPSLFGEGTPDQETATGQKMLSDQAKGQLSPAWGGMQWIFAGTYSLAVKKAATLDSDKPIIAIQGSKGSSKFSPQDILNGNWGCFPDTDSSFPETMADKRAALQLVLTQLGEAAAPLLAQPDNLKLIKQYGGINDLIIPGAEARDKALREIEQLLQETPVPDPTQMQQWQTQAQQAVANGQAAPPEPETCSIQIDPDWDFHQPIIDKVQEYLNSDSAFEETQKGNVRGLQNVKLYGMAHKKALAAQQQPSMGKPPNISITAQVTDPRTIAQILQLDGIQADPDNLAESMVPDLQQKAAQTQHSAAQAQHASVLAAKEAVEPVTTSFNPQPPPEPAVKEK
jgi:hypothetical protein